MFLERIDTQNNRTKVLLFFYMSKYFDKKKRKNMFFNIFVCFLTILIAKCRSRKFYAILSVKSTSGKVFDNWIMTLMSLMTLKICKTI